MYWRADMTVPFPYERIENGKDYGFRDYKVPELFYNYEGKTIWGLTAQSLTTLLPHCRVKKQNRNNRYIKSNFPLRKRIK